MGVHTSQMEMQKSRELCKSRWLLLLSSPETKKC